MQLPAPTSNRSGFSEPIEAKIGSTRDKPKRASFTKRSKIGSGQISEQNRMKSVSLRPRAADAARASLGRSDKIDIPRQLVDVVSRRYHSCAEDSMRASWSALNGRGCERVRSRSEARGDARRRWGRAH